MSRFPTGYECLGADDGGMAVVVRVNNISELVKKQAGGKGVFAQMLAPQTVASEVYKKIRDKLDGAFRNEGVNADVSVTSAPPGGSAPKAEFLTGVVIGGGVVAGTVVLWKYVVRRIFFKE